jgi:hypothetical protein
MAVERMVRMERALRNGKIAAARERATFDSGAPQMHRLLTALWGTVPWATVTKVADF